MQESRREKEHVFCNGREQEPGRHPVPGSCRAIPSHVPVPPTPMILLLPLVPWSLPRASQAPTPSRFLHRPRLLHRVIILPFPCPRSAVPSHASAPSGPLTSTLMSPLPGYQEIEYQLQNRCSILEPIVNFGKVLKLIIGI